eukprot:TRINITY_DN4217_c0_g1_i1.p1 TRINITY_DN4217_c0_g1~~TRINITY_DN4217_c0_g1_i1.p1  ORF type:complete len:247 (+),score=40.19 TRINITY_DN4217_c0_g1_i1:67-807(+)
MGAKGHVIVGSLTLICMIFAGTSLTDGRSLVKLNELMDLTKTMAAETTLVSKRVPGIYFPYGIGVYQDTYGNKWTEGSSMKDYYLDPADNVPATLSETHPAHWVTLLECDDHKTRGLVVLSSGLIALIASFFAIVASFAGVYTGKGVFGTISLVCNILMVLFFLIGTALMGSFYNEGFDCKDNLGNTFELTMKDHFDLGYALPFYVVALVVSVVNVACIFAFGAMVEEEHDDDSSSESSGARPDEE